MHKAGVGRGLAEVPGTEAWAQKKASGMHGELVPPCHANPELDSCSLQKGPSFLPCPGCFAGTTSQSCCGHANSGLDRAQSNAPLPACARTMAAGRALCRGFPTPPIPLFLCGVLARASLPGAPGH